MSTTLFFVIAFVETVTIGGLFLLYPRFARRGLLFGVYVGEQTSNGPEARTITVSWYRGMMIWLIVGVAAAMALGAVVPKRPLIAVFPMALVAGFVVLYVRAYHQAQQFAVPATGPSVAFLQNVPEPSLRLPIAALVAGVLGGVICIAYSITSYPQLPDRIPSHFGISGAPDGWHAKSFSSVMTDSLMTLVIGVGLGGIAIFTARAKRAVRYSSAVRGIADARVAARETEISLQAQLRFRRAVTRLISTISIFVAIMMTSVHIIAIRVGLGRARGIPWPVMALMLLIVLLAIAGTIYIGLRYGQGGSRLERAAATAPLTNGLADNRRWVLGAFYVNRDDPSFLVEDRFGLGYTLNFGNRKAVLAFGGFLAAIAALAVAAIVFI